MKQQKSCPICRRPSSSSCAHLALAVEGKDFVRCCVQQCQARDVWQTLCARRRERLRRVGEWAPEREDFCWLETAFCEEFLKGLAWFQGVDYEWRTGPKAGQGGFWVLLWSKDSQRLWWQLREQIERQCAQAAFIVRPAGSDKFGPSSPLPPGRGASLAPPPAQATWLLPL